MNSFNWQLCIGVCACYNISNAIRKISVVFWETWDFIIQNIGSPMDDKETVLLIDSWKDQNSLDVHHASPMMAKITELRGKYDLHMRVERYVSDEIGVPVADRAFIKE